MELNVFSFDDEWARVLEVLDHPLAQRALNAGMTSLCDANSQWKIAAWKPGDSPWGWSCGDGWHMDAREKFEASSSYEEWNEWCKSQGCPDYEDDPEASDKWFDQKACDKLSEMEAPFFPQPRTPDWYRCWGACHWLAVWNCAIGELLFPDMEWLVIKGDEHSTALGLHGGELMCVDILWGQDHVSEIWEAVRDGECSTLMEEIEWQETRPYLDLPGDDNEMRRNSLEA